MENIFWVGLLIIIIFLLIRYRILEMKIKSFENYDKVEQLQDLKKRKFYLFDMVVSNLKTEELIVLKQRYYVLMMILLFIVDMALLLQLVMREQIIHF